MEKKKIYILHEYDIKSHFSALYEAEHKGIINIEEYIVLSRMFLIKKLIKDIINKKGIYTSFKYFLCEVNKNFKIKRIKNEILIVGIAPYDKLMNKYKDVFKENKSIYFTSWTDWSGNNFPKGTINNKKNFERILKDNFYAAACVSTKSEEGIKHIISNTVVVNHAINTYEYKVKNREDIKFNKKKLLYLGQLIPRKNINMILEWIKSCNNKFEFDFAGDGELRSDIESNALKDDRIRYLGKLNKEQIKIQLKKYDFLVLPSKEEPFGIVLIEALASGVPCIVSDADGPREIVKNGYNGYIFNKNSQSEFNKTMNRIFKISMEEYYQLSRNSILASKAYDNNEIIKQWLKVLE